MADYTTSATTGAGAGAGVGTAISPGLGSVIGAVIGAGAGLIGSWIQNKFTSDANEKNLKFAKEQFNYQKYLNENQFGIMSNSAQSAGINPIAMTGGSVQSTQMSAGQTATDISPAISGIANVGTTIMNNNTQRAISAESNKTAVNVAQINAESNQEIEKIRQENENKRQQNQIKAQEIIEARRSKIQEESNRIQEIDIKNQDSARRALQQLKETESILEYELKQKENERQNEKLQNEKKELELAIKQQKWSHAMDIWRSIRETIKDIGVATGAVLHGVGSVSSDSGSGRSIGFKVD